MSDYPEPITEQDRDDAVTNLKESFIRLAAELSIIDALDGHRLVWEDSKNLGYYRTFVECSCGTGFWYGEHEGDPSADDRWDVHRAGVVAAVEAVRVFS